MFRDMVYIIVAYCKFLIGRQWISCIGFNIINHCDGTVLGREFVLVNEDDGNGRYYYRKWKLYKIHSY